MFQNNDAIEFVSKISFKIISHSMLYGLTCHEHIFYSLTTYPTICYKTYMFEQCSSSIFSHWFSMPTTFAQSGLRFSRFGIYGELFRINFFLIIYMSRRWTFVWWKCRREIYLFCLLVYRQRLLLSFCCEFICEFN